MHGFLKQSTAATILAGPFVAQGDGVTAKTSLTAPSGAASAASTGVALVKNGVASSYTLSGWAHERLGYYTVNLGTGDTDTVGRLRLQFIDPANYCPVEVSYVVLSAAVYDWLFGTTAPNTVTPLDAAGTRTALGMSTANLDSQLTAIDDYVDTEVAAIKAKTDLLPSDPASAGTISTAFGVVNTTLGVIAGKTTNLPADPADASDIGDAFAAVNTTLGTIAGYIDTEVSAIKSKTDGLPSDPADASVISDAFTSLTTLVNAVKTVTDILNGMISAGAYTAPALANAPGAGSSVATDGGTVSASPTPTTTTFTATGASLHAPTGGYTVAPMWLYFTGGVNQGIKTPISAHVKSGSNHAFTVSALPAAPGTGDTFIII